MAFTLSLHWHCCFTSEKQLVTIQTFFAYFVSQLNGDPKFGSSFNREWQCGHGKLSPHQKCSVSPGLELCGFVLFFVRRQSFNLGMVNSKLHSCEDFLTFLFVTYLLPLKMHILVQYWHCRSQVPNSHDSCSSTVVAVRDAFGSKNLRGQIFFDRWWIQVCAWNPVEWAVRSILFYC